MLLKDICVLDVACCRSSTSIVEAARLMRQHHVGDLVVVDDPGDERVPLGILTDRDIVVEVLGNDRDPRKTTVGEIALDRLVVAADTDDTAVAVQRMQAHGVRRLVVVNRAGSLAGVFTLDDALKLHAARAAELVEIASRAAVHERRTRR